MKQVLLRIILTALCLCSWGCATIKESRGDLLEDVGKLIFDIRRGLTDFTQKTLVIKDIEHLKGY